LAVAKERNLHSYIYFMLLATTRLRKSEALALLWSDINFKKKPVDVNKTSANRVGNKILVQSPKVLTQNGLLY